MQQADGSTQYNQVMTVRNYQDLLAWQKAVDLVVAVHQVTRLWPAEERYGLTAQIQRAAVSVPSNLAEGQGRRSDKEFSRYCHIAHGSLREVETQLIIAQRLGYLSSEQLALMLTATGEIGRLITGLINSLAAD